MARRRQGRLRQADGTLPRGLSRNQICVGVGCDESGRSTFIREGLDKTPAGRQHRRCPACGKPFSVLVGTALEYGKKPLPTRGRFITCMCYSAPLDLIAEICEVTHKTAFGWRHRVFATVDGYQDRLVLGGRVWIDELYLTDSDIVRGADFVQRRGLSKSKICIAVAIDAFKNAVVAICGHGKPSSKRIEDALLSRIAPGSVVVHDKEKSRKALAKAAKCTDESYRADRRTSRRWSWSTTCAPG